jgi:hypothetical protein
VGLLQLDCGHPARQGGPEDIEKLRVGVRWVGVEALWPLPRPLADQWLAGWNHVDRFAAVSALTKPDEPGTSRPVTTPAYGPKTESA